MPENARTPLIDCDSHCAEPPDLWEGDYMDPAYRGASHFRFVDIVDAKGRPRTVLWEGSFQIMQDAAYSATAGVPYERLERGVRYLEANPGAWDAKARLTDLDREAIDYQLINPSVAGLRLGLVKDAGLAAAMCRAYNDWITDHCADGEGRLFANMLVPWQDLGLARQEVERCADRPCLRGVVICPSPPYASGWIGDRAFDTVYSVIEERDLALNVHSADPFESYLAPLVNHYTETRGTGVEDEELLWSSLAPTTYWLALGFPIEQWTAWAQLCFEGVLDRHPNLRVMLTESHGGWMVTCLERLDEYASGGERLRVLFKTGQKLLPSEYFERQGFVVFEGDEKAFSFAAEHIGRSMVWGADYPHADATFPGAGDAIRANLATLPEELQRAVAWENGRRALGLA